MIFHIGLAFVTALIMFYFLILVRKSAVRRLFVLVFFGTGIVMIMRPELTVRVAHGVGVGRGADLIFYLSILFLFFMCFNFYFRFHSVEEKLTVLVRALALHVPSVDADSQRAPRPADGHAEAVTADQAIRVNPPRQEPAA
jgi:hypothetical protein